MDGTSKNDALAKKLIHRSVERTRPSEEDQSRFENELDAALKSRAQITIQEREVKETLARLKAERAKIAKEGSVLPDWFIEEQKQEEAKRRASRTSERKKSSAFTSGVAVDGSAGGSAGLSKSKEIVSSERGKAEGGSRPSTVKSGMGVGQPSYQPVTYVQRDADEGPTTSRVGGVSQKAQTDGISDTKLNAQLRSESDKMTLPMWLRETDAAIRARLMSMDDHRKYLEDDPKQIQQVKPKYGMPGPVTSKVAKDYLDVLAKAEEKIRSLDPKFTATKSYVGHSKTGTRTIETIKGEMDKATMNSPPYITPKQLLNCGYLRLTPENVRRLEELSRLEGEEPGMHKHMTADDVTAFFDNLQQVGLLGEVEDSLNNSIKSPMGSRSPLATLRPDSPSTSRPGYLPAEEYLDAKRKAWGSLSNSSTADVSGTQPSALLMPVYAARTRSASLQHDLYGNSPTQSTATRRSSVSVDGRKMPHSGTRL